VRLRGDGGAVPQQTMKVPPRAQRGALCTPVAARARAQGCAACTGGRRTAAAASCLSCLTPPCSAPPALPGSGSLQAPRRRASAAAGRAMRRIASGAPGAARAGVEAGGRAPGARARQVLLQGSEGGDGEGKYLKYAAALLDKVYPGRGMSSSLRLEHVRNMQASDFYKVWKVRPPRPPP